MKLNDLKTHEQVLAEQLRDPAFRAEWERLTLARAVSTCLATYRATHKLTQRAMAAKLGIRQPQVARLESGEHEPDLKTLRMLSAALDVEFLVDIAPAHRSRPMLRKRPRRAALYEEAALPGGLRLTVAAG